MSRLCLVGSGDDEHRVLAVVEGATQDDESFFHEIVQESGVCVPVLLFTDRLGGVPVRRMSRRHREIIHLSQPMGGV